MSIYSHKNKSNFKIIYVKRVKATKNACTRYVANVLQDGILLFKLLEFG